MLNKKLVLGSLAGATLLVGAAILLPSAASAAGMVSGTCVNCHTMHNSQDGLNMNGTGTPNGQLLIVNGCAGCHAMEANGGNGRGATRGAPQVGNLAAATANAGGYFNTATPAATHSVTGSIAGLAEDLLTAPGGTFAITTGSDSFVCEDCHGEALGGHHTYPAADSVKTGIATDSYRMLNPVADEANTATAIYVAGQGDVDYEAGAGANIYNASGMNLFCANCHGTFHGVGNTNAASPFVRHPTDVGTSVVAYPNGAGWTTSTTIPTGTVTNDGATAAADNMVMCLSCHRAHGSAEMDMLRFSYALNIAGTDTVASTGCESCHGAK